MPYYADRCGETSTTTGTGSFTTSGVAMSGCQTLVAGLGSSPKVVGYAIESQTPGQWEVGKGTFNGSTGLTRDVVRSSSNSGALVNFSAGTKNVFISPSSEHFGNANLGMQYAVSRGFAMP